MSGDKFLLEESTNTEFLNPEKTHISNIYASTLTGLDNGTYYYRIKNNNNEWSNTAKVVVQHHSLDKAFLFFTLGCCLFVLIITTLIIGHTKTTNKTF